MHCGAAYESVPRLLEVMWLECDTAVFVGSYHYFQTTGIVASNDGPL